MDNSYSRYGHPYFFNLDNKLFESETLPYFFIQSGVGCTCFIHYLHCTGSVSAKIFKMDLTRDKSRVQKSSVLKIFQDSKTRDQ